MCNLVHRLLYRRVFLNQYPTRLCQTAKHNVYKSIDFHKSTDKLPLAYVCSQNITTMSETDKLFEGRKDHYKGVTIDSLKESCDSTIFLDRLTRSLANWTSTGIRGVWFKVALTHADWVPILANNGFVYHHAQSKYVMMYKWLPTDEESNIPKYAHTMIGVGAVVVNEADEILVIREKYSFRGFVHWKLPGGYVEPGEDLEDAAIREVLEETSIQTKFQCLISFRHTHGGNFGCSDIYFVVGLEPLSKEITKCEREIVAAEWMKIDEYMNHDMVHESNRFFVQKYLEYKKTGTIIGAQKASHPLLKRPYTVFNIVNEEITTNNDMGEKSKI